MILLDRKNDKYLWTGFKWLALDNFGDCAPSTCRWVSLHHFLETTFFTELAHKTIQKLHRTYDTIRYQVSNGQTAPQIWCSLYPWLLDTMQARMGISKLFLLSIHLARGRCSTSYIYYNIFTAQMYFNEPQFFKVILKNTHTSSLYHVTWFYDKKYLCTFKYCKKSAI